MPNWLNRTAMGFAYQNLEKANSLAGLLSPTVSGYLHQSLEVVLLLPGLQSPTVVYLILNAPSAEAPARVYSEARAHTVLLALPLRAPPLLAPVTLLLPP